jgi:hypothetical protein
MRILSLILLILCVSCAKSNKETPEKPVGVTDSLSGIQPETVVDSSKLVKVEYYVGEYKYFEKEPYDKFRKWFNEELNPNYILSPDEARAIFDKSRLQRKFNFKEATFMVSGFYVLYGHFLKERNGKKADASLRKRTVKSFMVINDIYREISGGHPSYFRHQEVCISGYVEFVVYNYLRMGESLDKKFDIKKQRQIYIQSLRQEVLDAEADPESLVYGYMGEITNRERKERINTALQLVDELEPCIETYFDLKAVQQYHYSHYM